MKKLTNLGDERKICFPYGKKFVQVKETLLNIIIIIAAYQLFCLFVHSAIK